MVEMIFICAFLGTLVVMAVLMIANQWMHHKHTGDLLDRLMARDLPELATFQIEREQAKVKGKDPEAEKAFIQF